MPILWRYLLSHYFRVLIFCVIAFIAILLCLRLNEIAHFASLGPGLAIVFRFIAYQIPYILPIALPISCLISSILLIRHLSATQELTALRASGVSLKDILAPLLIAAAFLSLGNFYVVSEVATSSHLESNLLKNELRSVNPLLLLHNKHLLRTKGIYFDTLGASKMGQLAADAVIGMPNKSANRINLLLARSLEASDETFKGQGITLVTSLTPPAQTSFDQVVIENIQSSITAIEDFAQTIQKKVWTVNNDHLNFNMLKIRLEEEKIALKNGAGKPAQRSIDRIYTEMLRRFSMGTSVFIFTLMGLAFGITIGRVPSKKGLAIAIFLSALYLASFFIAKGIDHHLIASALLLTIPSLLIVILSLWALVRVSRGIA